MLVAHPYINNSTMDWIGLSIGKHKRQNKSMELISQNSQSVQDIKSMLKEKLGIIFALPKYSFNEGSKVHFMVQLYI